MKTNIDYICTVGNIVGQPVLTHVTAKVIANNKYYFEPKVIPSIAYTFLEVAWVGMARGCKNYERGK